MKNKETPRILEVVKYGHPALRSKGRNIETIDESIRDLAADMLATMYEEEGCGLAAHQVGRTIRMAVIDVLPAFDDRPSRAWKNGIEIDVSTLMPLVMVNPTIEPVGEERSVEGEGCLSMPGIIDDVDRPSRVRVTFTNLDGDTLSFEAEGLLSRAAQHEVDHLEGILFIDHLSPEDRASHEPKLRKFLPAGGLF
jgi:peptide deformylase